MLNQNNISICLLLLQQQIRLQNELNKYCNLIASFEILLEPLQLSSDTLPINHSLDYVVAALIDAKSTNKDIIHNLQILLALSVISSNPIKP